jgi:hypothetical protein
LTEQAEDSFTFQPLWLDWEHLEVVTCTDHLEGYAGIKSRGYAGAAFRPQLMLVVQVLEMKVVAVPKKGRPSDHWAFCRLKEQAKGHHDEGTS